MIVFIRSLIIAIAALVCALPAAAQKIESPTVANHALHAGHDALSRLEYSSALSYYSDAYAFGNPRGAVGLSVIYALGLGQPVSHEKASAYAISADQEPDFDAVKYLTPFYERSNIKAIALVIADVYEARIGQDAKRSALDWRNKHQ